MSCPAEDPNALNPPRPPRGLALRLLGGFEWSVDGKALPTLRPRTAQWIIALLALRRRPVERSVLAETLWPESSRETGLSNLRRYLVQIRSLLGDEAHRLQSPSPRLLSLDLTDAWLDVAEFDARAASADPAALGLYRGPLLEGCHADWVLPEREARAQACLTLLARLAEGAEQAGDLALAAGYLREAIARNPLGESAHRRLIRVLGAGGNYAEATRTFRELRALLHRDVNAPPDPATVAAYEEVKEHAARRRGTPAVPERRLPHALSSFVGRETEMREVLLRLRAARLVTLSGTGGVGKTRLALRCAEAAAGTMAAEACFVDLAQVVEAGMVPAAAAAALGVRERPGTPLMEAIAGHIADRALVMVLDNCEHVLDAAAGLAGGLLSVSPRLRILATSRQALGLTGEVVFRVPSLSLPEVADSASDAKDGVSSLMNSEAFRLFVDRASAVSSHFRLTRENAAAVEAICRRLDGIPLAIELAAARARAMDVTRIRMRLERDSALLSGSGAAPERQRTLAGLIDWSHRLLSEPERVLFRRLSVFTGGWDPDAAETVCGRPPLRGDEVPDLLTALVDRSLVDYEPRDGQDRYRLLQTLQAFADERLLEAGEADALREAWVQFYVDFADAAALEPEVRDRLKRVDSEWDNLMAVAAACDEVSGGAGLGLRLAAALRAYWLPRGMPQLGLTLTRRALQRGLAQPPGRAHAEALLAAGTLALRTGQDGDTEELLGAALIQARALGLASVEAAALTMLGHVTRLRGDAAGARARFEDAIRVARANWEPLAEGSALNGIAEMLRAAGEWAEAARLYTTALERARSAGDGVAAAIVMNNLAMTRIQLGEHAGARDLLLQALEVARMLESPQTAQFALAVTAGLAFARMEWRFGTRLLGGVDALRARLGFRQEPEDAKFAAVGIQRAREALGEEAFAAEHASGGWRPYPALLHEAEDWLESVA